MAKKPWSAEALQALKALYPDISNESLAELFNRSPSSISARAHQLGLKKSDEYNRKVKRSARTCFKPGHKPWNKGKSFHAGGRSAETQFKKGAKPANWRPIGTERVTRDGYLQRKVTDTGVTRHDFVAVHHLVWREHTGQPVPKGHALIFKDGNKRNFDINNLKLLSRAELMDKNSVQRLPPEIKQGIRLIAGFNRRLRRIEKNECNSRKFTRNTKPNN